MPDVNGAWRIIRRCLVRTTVSPDTVRTPHDIHRAALGATHAAHAGSSRLRAFCDWIKREFLNRQRHSDLLARERIRNDRRAKRRALGLLMGLLSDEQRQEFCAYRHFHVVGGLSGNRYRIRVAAFANIDVLGFNESVMYRLCAHPAGDIPVYDVMAAQLLHLQDAATEQRFLQHANVHPALSEDGLRTRTAWIS